MSLVKHISNVYELTNHGFDVLSIGAEDGEAKSADETRLKTILLQEDKVAEFVGWSLPMVMRLLVKPDTGVNYYMYSKCKYAIVRNKSGDIVEKRGDGDTLLLYCGLGQSPAGKFASKLYDEDAFTKLIKRKGDKKGKEILKFTRKVMLDLGIDTEDVDEFLQELGGFKFDATSLLETSVPFEQRYVSSAELDFALSQLAAPALSNNQKEMLFTIDNN